MVGKTISDIQDVVKNYDIKFEKIDTSRRRHSLMYKDEVEYRYVENEEIKNLIAKLEAEINDWKAYKLMVASLDEKYKAAKKAIDSAYIKMSILDSKIDNITPSSQVTV